jgi:hypothetical protein
MRADVVIGLLCATALAMASTADASVSKDASVRSSAGSSVVTIVDWKNGLRPFFGQ